MKDELIRWREAGSDAPDDIREMFRAASDPAPLSEEEMAVQEERFLERVRALSERSAPPRRAKPSGAKRVNREAREKVKTAPRRRVFLGPWGAVAAVAVAAAVVLLSRPGPPPEIQVARRLGLEARLHRKPRPWVSPLTHASAEPPTPPPPK